MDNKQILELIERNTGVNYVVKNELVKLNANIEKLIALLEKKA